MVRSSATVFALLVAAGSVSAHWREEARTVNMTGTHLLAARAVPQDYLTAHNNERAKHGAKALVWDASLASSAQAWANQCKFQHSQSGQNLYAGTGNPTAAAAVGAWNAESKDYNSGNPQASHWTQVVWKGTTKLGCALKQCAPGTIFDASYGVSDMLRVIGLVLKLTDYNTRLPTTTSVTMARQETSSDSSPKTFRMNYTRAVLAERDVASEPSFLNIAALALGTVGLTTIAFSGSLLKSNSPRSSLSAEEAEFYYFGLPSCPVLVARTTTKPKQLHAPGRHPIDKVWEDDPALKVICISLMNSTSVRWTSLDIFRIGYTGELSFPLVLWVGVMPSSLSSDDNLPLATECKGILERYKIMDVDVEIRESVVTCSGRPAGPQLLTRPDSRDPTANVGEPLTSTTLGPPLCSRRTPWAAGTGGCFFIKSSDPDTALLLTVRHAVFPDTKDNELFEQTHNSQPHHEVMLLSKPEFKEYLRSIVAKIDTKKYVANQLEQLLGRLAGAEDQERQQRFRNVQKSLDDTNEAIVSLAFGVDRKGYTEDWVAIEMKPSKINSTNFGGNAIDLGAHTSSEFTKKMCRNIQNRSSFEYPGNGVLKAGSIPDKKTHAPTAKDENGDPCLVVIKRGCGTGLAIGHASHMVSYRRLYPGSFSGTSKEWLIVSANPESGPFLGEGDSGSVIVDDPGRIGGLLTGGTV